MEYIDFAYYQTVYNGELVKETDFLLYYKFASLIIEKMTLNKVNSNTFDSFHEQIKDKIRLAACLQMDYFALNGGIEEFNISDDFQSVGLGKFNYSKGSTCVKKELYSPLACEALLFTGLLYRGGGCY